MVDVGAYLDRIGFHGKPLPDAETLRGLHRAHLLAVPFENLDIHLGRRIVSDAGQRSERPIDGEPAFRKALLDHFGVRLPKGP